jgi:hypothetical protein
MLTEDEWGYVRQAFFKATADPSLYDIESQLDAPDIFPGETTHLDLKGEFWGQRILLIEIMQVEAPSVLLFLQTDEVDITCWHFAAWQTDGVWSVIDLHNRDVTLQDGPMAMTDQPAADQGTQQKLYQHIQIFGHPGSYIFRPDNDADSEQTFRHYNQALLRAIRFLVDSMQNEV